MGLAVLAFLGILLWRLIRPDPPVAAAEWQAPPVGEAFAGWTEDGAPLLVVHHLQGGFTAVEAVSPHRPWGIKKLVGWCPSSRTFDDPFHGSRFDEYGRYLVGPSPTGLVRRAVEVVPGSPSLIKVRGRLPAQPRGAASPPTGRFCIGDTVQDSGLVMPAIAGSGLTPRELVADPPCPPGSRWSVEAVLHATRGSRVRLCASLEGSGRCGGGAPVLGLDEGALLDESDPFTFRGEWLVLVEEGGLADIIRAA